MDQYHITLLRHAESKDNTAGIIQGQNDTPLSAIGYDQAKALGRYWARASRTFDAVFASPLDRARRTAEIVSEALHVRVNYDPVWMEHDFGSIAGTQGGVLDSWLQENDLVHPYLPVGEGGESIYDLYLRGGRAVLTLMKNPPGTYLIVAHGGILNMVLYAILGITPMPNFLGPRFKFRNTAYTTLTYTPCPTSMANDQRQRTTSLGEPMIIRQVNNGYICIQQHDHAKLSGWLAASWGNNRVPPNDTSQNALVLATAMHDIGWVEIDAEPQWNESEGQPHSFQDEPLERRVSQYTSGIDQVAQEDPYAALLCSRHYTSFFSTENLAQLGEPAITFVAHEKKRQVALSETLSSNERGSELARVDYDLTLLKLYDHISLFIGLNTPGASKTDEHPWYREGFQPIYLSYPDYNAGDPTAQVSFQTRWLDTRQISLKPFPFPRPLTCILPYRQVMQDVIDAIGYPAAYQHALPQTQIIQFTDSQ